MELIEGYVTSADAGSEEVVRHSREALASFCDEGEEERGLVCNALMALLRRNMGSAKEQVLVSGLEVMVFLFDVQIMQESNTR